MIFLLSDLACHPETCKAQTVAVEGKDGIASQADGRSKGAKSRTEMALTDSRSTCIYSYTLGEEKTRHALLCGVMCGEDATNPVEWEL